MKDDDTGGLIVLQQEYYYAYAAGAQKSSLWKVHEKFRAKIRELFLRTIVPNEKNNIWYDFQIVFYMQNPTFTWTSPHSRFIETPDATASSV